MLACDPLCMDTAGGQQRTDTDLYRAWGCFDPRWSPAETFSRPAQHASSWLHSSITSSFNVCVCVFVKLLNKSNASGSSEAAGAALSCWAFRLDGKKCVFAWICREPLIIIIKELFWTLMCCCMAKCLNLWIGLLSFSPRGIVVQLGDSIYLADIITITLYYKQYVTVDHTLLSLSICALLVLSKAIIFKVFDAKDPFILYEKLFSMIF